MAENTENRSNQNLTTSGNSISDTPKPISRATLVLIAAGVLFVIIAAIVFTKIFNAPTGVPESGSTGAQSSSNR